MTQLRLFVVVPLALAWSLAVSCADQYSLIGRWEVVSVQVGGMSKEPTDNDRFLEFRADGSFRGFDKSGDQTATGRFERVSPQVIKLTIRSAGVETVSRFQIDRLDAEELALSGGRLDDKGEISLRNKAVLRRVAVAPTGQGSERVVMLKCAGCGQLNEDGSNYCQKCGAKLKD